MFYSMESSTTKILDNPEINRVIWIDKNVFNNENQGYKKIMEEKYNLKVDVNQWKYLS